MTISSPYQSPAPTLTFWPGSESRLDLHRGRPSKSWIAMIFKMQTQFIRYLGCAVLGLAVLIQTQAGQLGIEAFAAKGNPRSTTNIHQLRREWWYDQRAYPLGYIP